MRTGAGVLVVVISAAFPAAARAATVQRVAKDQSKVLLSLSQAELAALEEGQELLIEFGRDRWMRSATVGTINVVKKTAVLEFTGQERRIKRRDTVSFLSYFWNPILSPLTFSHAQYHQYPRSSVETTIGIFGTDLSRKVDDGEEVEIADGTAFVLDGYLLFNPDFAGASLGYERRQSLTTISAGDQRASADMVMNRVRPGIWLQFQPKWRVSLRYDYTAMDVTRGSGEDKIVYQYDFYEPRLGFVWYEAAWEAGVVYKDKDEFKAIDTRTYRDGRTEDFTELRKMPAELDLHYRRVTSPTFLWGGSAGWVFHERDRGPDQPLAPKGSPLESLRLATTFEHRLDGGAKLDWRVALEGANVPTHTTEARGINTLGGLVHYYVPLAKGLVVGGLLELAGGVKTDEVDGFDPATGEPGKRKRESSGFLFNVQAQARYEFDAGGGGRRSDRRL